MISLRFLVNKLPLCFKKKIFITQKLTLIDDYQFYEFKILRLFLLQARQS